MYQNLYCFSSFSSVYVFYEKTSCDLVKQKVEKVRGFTGHEHYPQFKIINMNGRLYDPVIARFFSPDNFVQLPEFTQSYNRYSYCLNNPLKYVDTTYENYTSAGLCGKKTFRQQATPHEQKHTNTMLPSVSLQKLQIL